MQNPAPPPPLPTPAPATVITPVPGQPSLFEINPQGPTRPLTQQEVNIIRSQRSEMSDQLQSAQNRRERVLNELRNAPAGTEAGLQQQYQVLSDRIVAIETDIEASGRVLRTGQVPAQLVLVPPRGSISSGNRTDDVERMGALGATILIPIAAIYMWRSFRRRRRGARREVEISAEHDSRFERLEQAVDAIALEIERVGEAQRYQSKLLTEANMMPAMGVSQKVGEQVRARDFDR
ncbi:MAG TPA: hypothetical protein VFD64_12005 [Gemmatimonadaceae bacterium]|nr:hypothetical protein [Gemmatimonadaceae bacterium]